jgi:hypothetical protein
MFIPTRVIFLWNHVWPDDEKWFPWLRQFIHGQLLKHHGFSYLPLLDLENHWPRLRNSPKLLRVVCTSKPEQQTPSAFHTPNEHNSSHKN